MSQADALLNSISEKDASLYLVDSDGEPHIVIGDNRRITVPESLKRIAVQHDHDMETVTFDCPRFWDNHDMSQMAIYINYMRSDGYGDSYPARNVEADGDIMHFTWTISRNVTEVAGVLSFLVCVKNVDENNEEVNHWNTEICQDMRVSEGMETEEQVLDYYPDLVTQLLLRMDTVEQISVTKEYIDGLVYLAENAADEAEQARAAIDNSAAEIRNSYCNAIKKIVTGETVTMDDVSPLEHDVNIFVHRKNLFNINAVVDGSFGVYSVNGNSITFNYEADYGNYFPFAYWLNVIPNTVYTLTIGHHTSIGRVYGYIDKVFGTQILATVVDSNTGSVTFNSGNNRRILLGFYSITDQRDLSVTSEIVSNIQIEENPVATEYEPYIDPTTVTVTVTESGSIATPASDGTCIVKSVYPNMTISTDTEGVIVKAEYSRDQHAVLGDLDAALDTILDLQASILGGEV